MSLFRPERLHISIQADRAAVVKTRGWRQRDIVADTVVGLALDAPGYAMGLEPLALALSKPGFGAASARIVLADSLVRYFICPLPGGVRNLKELESMFAVEFEAQLGLDPVDWMLSANLEPAARRYLVCAAPRLLIEALQRCCAIAKVRIDALAPFLVSEFNGWRTRFSGRQPAWFAALDGESIILTYRDQSGFCSVRSHPRESAADAGLQRLVDREGLRFGAASGAALAVAGVGISQVKLDPPFQNAILGAAPWPGRSESWSKSYRLALSGMWT